MTRPERHRTTIVPYDSSWPAAFETMAAALLGCSRGHLRSIEHIGSTAVPGLAAKPVLDLLGELSVDHLEGERELADDIASLGFACRSGEFTDRFLFSRSKAGLLTHNLHVVPSGTISTRNEVLFRDRLRHDAAARDAYAAFKYELAETSYPDPHGYSRAKSNFVFSVVSEERDRLQLPPWDIWKTLGAKRKAGWVADGSRPPSP